MRGRIQNEVYFFQSGLMFRNICQYAFQTTSRISNLIRLMTTSSVAEIHEFFSICLSYRPGITKEPSLQHLNRYAEKNLTLT